MREWREDGSIWGSTLVTMPREEIAIPVTNKTIKHCYAPLSS